MGGKKIAGIVLLVVGIVVLLLSLFADFIGIWGGAVMTVVGLVLILKKQSPGPHLNLDCCDTWRVRADYQCGAEETIAVGSFPFGPSVSHPESPRAPSPLM